MVWNFIESFERCGKEIELETEGKEQDDSNGDDQLWYFKKNFLCEANEVPETQCHLGGNNGGVVTCTNEGHVKQVFPALIKKLETALKDKNYKSLYNSYTTALQASRS